MRSDKTAKKKKRKASQVLLPVIALLVIALLAAAMLYMRLDPGKPFSPLSAISPYAPEYGEETVNGEKPAEPSPLEPTALFFDLQSAPGVLDVVICDSEGSAVPGYAFPLEIRYQDGSSYRVFSDVNGHYYAAYIQSGEYSISMLPLEGFVPAETVVCRVARRTDDAAVGYIGSFTEDDGSAAASAASNGEDGAIEGLSAALPPADAGNYSYRFSTGENGFLLFADGTESDVLPVELRGELVYGLRTESVCHLPDGTVVQPEELPDDAVLWTDYYTDEKAVAVPLILGGGAVNEQFAITAERVDPSAARRSGWVEENGRSYYYAADGRPVSGLQNIDGKLYFFDGSGAKASELGIDVSYHNSAIDWNAVKAAGIDFAIIRAAYRTWEKGILNEDEDSYRQGKNGGYYLQGAKAAGLKVGVYVYSTAITTDEAVEEAEKAIEIVRKSGVELDLPIYFDSEYSSVNPRGRADRLTPAQRVEIARAFCETVEKAGYSAGVYSYENFFHRALPIGEVDDYDIWYASYTRGYALPTYRGFSIWQFTESARVNGMPDEVDMNVIF